MQCNQCGFDNAPGVEVCARCGAAMPSAASALPEIGVDTIRESWRMTGGIN